jgi:hypothetical protein
MALFGCRPNYPLSYLGKAGLLWQVNGGKVIELHRDWAVIDRPGQQIATHLLPAERRRGERCATVDIAAGENRLTRPVRGVVYAAPLGRKRVGMRAVPDLAGCVRQASRG